MKKHILLFFLILISTAGLSQQQQNTAALKELARKAAAQYKKDSVLYITQQKATIINNTIESKGQTNQLFYGMDVFGQPIYISTNDAISAKTLGTNKVKTGGSLGLNLGGEGVHMAIWDIGSARTTHEAFNNTGSPRLIQKDSEEAVAGHPTAVASVMVDGGLDAAAEGMAKNGTLFAYNATYDASEMANEASAGMTLSSHSYATTAGWSLNSGVWTWANSFSSFLGHTEDYNFGHYNSNAHTWDDIMYNAPNYLIVKAAGNDRDDGGTTNPNTGGTNYKWPEGPYDCIPTVGVAKNILTVGAIHDIPNGYTSPTDVVLEVYSSCGPADDGRIKPDIVASGQSVRTAYNGSDSQYINGFGGTSAASPAIAGSIALLQQHYKNIFGATSSAAKMKALVLHTADEAGINPGPDYEFGWGVMNTAKAATKIIESKSASILLKEQLLNNTETYTIKAIAKGTEPIKATVVWTDPAGTPITSYLTVLDNPTKMLVNDLDFRITHANGTHYYPWSLSAANPINAATNVAKNNTDNVEGISIGNVAAGTIMTLTINHVGSLTNASQWFSMATDGLVNNDNFADAITIVPSEYGSPKALYSTAIGSADGGNYSCTMTSPKNNVWFKFEALTAEQSVFVLADGAHGTLQKPVLSLWNSTGVTQIACNQGTTANKAFLLLTNLTVGETYYIAVDNTNTNEAGSFTLYADASPLQTNTSTTGTIEPGTIRYNDLLGKFQGWNGTQWLNFN